MSLQVTTNYKFYRTFWKTLVNKKKKNYMHFNKIISYYFTCYFKISSIFKFKCLNIISMIMAIFILYRHK